MGSLNELSSQLSGMWSDMDAWFGSLQEQLIAMAGMLAGMARALEELIQKVDALQSQVEWVSIFAVLLEIQMRITWAVEMAQNISVTKSEQSSRSEGADAGGDTMPVQYNAQELNECRRRPRD
jgi:phage-related minor tail protein